MSNEQEIVIIGCGAAGGTAAQFARKTNRKASITVFEKSEHAQYSKCALPYILSGICKKEDIFEFSEDWFKRNNIDLLLKTKVERVDRTKKIVYAKKGNETIEKYFDSLIICTGAKPYIPRIENIDAEGVFSVRTIEDIEAISSYISDCKIATIIGAGLIGLEIADNLYRKGMKINIVEALPNILPNVFDEDMSKIVLGNIPDDVSIFTNHLATRINKANGKISSLIIRDNISNEEREIKTDTLIIATGIRANTELAKSLGCKIGETGGIVVDNRCRTSVSNIYAAGDCTEYIDFVTKRPVGVGLGSIAVRQGIAAGTNAAGGSYELNEGLLQTFTSEFFGLEVAGVGPNTKFLNGMPIVHARHTSSSLPGYFPGGKEVTIKLIANANDGKILNAQAIGDRAAHRINTFACAILAGLDVEKFRKLETAYAPPISPTLSIETIVCDIASLKIKKGQIV